MHIVNAMFAKGLGGIEQAFVDYCRALELQGNKVTAVIHPDAAIRPMLPATAEVFSIANSSQWDILARLRLRRLLKKLRPDAVIVHGNRAISLLKPAAKGICPVIGVTHNYSLKRLMGLNAVFATTQDLRQKMLERGYPEERIFKVPNMVVTVTPAHAGVRMPASAGMTIATLGRFVRKKGFDVFIKALAQLEVRNFRAVLGGKGEEEKTLKQLVEENKLSVEMPGWVEDKEAFFRTADIFVLPSRHEPFGIVLLEAMAHGLPIITTNSEGPAEIATHEHDALIVPKDNPNALAAAIARLMGDAALRQKLATNALETVRTKYDIKAVSALMQTALKKVTHDR